MRAGGAFLVSSDATPVVTTQVAGPDGMCQPVPLASPRLQTRIDPGAAPLCPGPPVNATQALALGPEQRGNPCLFIDASGGFVTQAQGELIYRALENVVRNAVKFTPPGGSVQVSAHVDPDSDQFVCLVEDRGPGVPAEMLESIFQPFARVAGTGHVQGVGLGLAIARRAFALHGGHIEARQREGGGLTMRMLLPRAVLYPP